MHVKCSHCKTRYRVTDENVRADGDSIKCRDCDTVIYFRNPPPVRIEREEPIEPMIMPPDIPDIEESREEEGTEKKELKPVDSGADRYRGTEHTYTAKKVPSHGSTKTKTSSQLNTLFEQILEKMESKGKESFSPKSPKYIHSPEVSYRTVLIVIVGFIILVGFIINVLSD